jgi:hypothetical protein
MSRVNPKLSSRAWDMANACAAGLIRNGHIVLLILVLFGASFMSRDMFGLARMIDETVETPADTRAVETTRVDNFIKAEAVTLEEFVQQSDQRVEGHRQCTFTDYRRLHEDACEELDRQVDEATQ